MATIAGSDSGERRQFRSAKWRRRTNILIFLGPAILLTFLFYILPVIVDIVISFTDMGRSLAVHEFTTKQSSSVRVSLPADGNPGRGVSVATTRL